MNNLDLKDFDVLKAYSINEVGIMHFGLYYQGCVIHCTPTQFNPWGGNIVSDTLAEFTSKRKIESTYPSKINLRGLQKFFIIHKRTKWTIFDLHCESFIRRMNEVSGSTYYLRLA